MILSQNWIFNSETSIETKERQSSTTARNFPTIYGLVVYASMLGSKFNSKVWDMYFYFTPLKTYHPRLLRTYKKVIPSCFFGNTQNSKSPTTSPFPFLFLLILSLANSILKTSLIFLGFQPQNHTKEAKFLTNCGAVRVWSERSALQAVHIEYILMHCSSIRRVHFFSRQTFGSEVL